MITQCCKTAAGYALLCISDVYDDYCQHDVLLSLKCNNHLNFECEKAL